MNKRHIGLAIALVLIIGSIYYLESQKVSFEDIDLEGVDVEIEEDTGTLSIRVEGQDESVDFMTPAQKAEIYEVAKEITLPAGYVNSDEFTIQEFIGEKVILVDFLTYSCINCQRTFPYVNAWYDKYKDQGLEVIGIHTPEFEFEKDIENVEQAAEQFGLEHRMVLDNDYGTWRAYKNRYWPRKYLIDIDGFIVYDHIGEGAYTSTEMKIQELLEERARKLGDDMEVSGGISEVTPIERGAGRLSPEVYFGSSRNEFLANGEQGLIGPNNFSLPDSSGLELNNLYLRGPWYIQPEYMKSEGDNATFFFPYNAQNVYMVTGADEPTKMTILIDGEPVGDLAGADVDSNGQVTVQAETLYHLIADPDGVNQHQLEIQAEEGAKIYTFTFG
jgi:thiol-disulfide isomerase/thioredoxin